MFAVDGRPHVELLRLRDLVGGGQPRPDGRERVGALALGRRAAALHLKRALGDVVDDAVSSNVLESVGLADVPDVATDDGSQLHFVVELDRVARPDDRIVRAVDGAGGLDEEQRLLGQLEADLSRVIGVVKADGDDLADAGEGTAQPWSPAHDRQAIDLHRAQALEPRRRDDLGRDVLHHPREVAQYALAVDEAGLLRADAAVTDELHIRLNTKARPDVEVTARRPRASASTRRSPPRACARRAPPRGSYRRWPRRPGSVPCAPVPCRRRSRS